MQALARARPIVVAAQARQNMLPALPARISETSAGHPTIRHVRCLDTGAFLS